MTTLLINEPKQVKQIPAEAQVKILSALLIAILNDKNSITEAKEATFTLTELESLQYLVLKYEAPVIGQVRVRIEEKSRLGL